MIGRIVRPKVYLEGFEIPAYKVTVQTVIGAPSMAIIECPPLEEFFDRYVDRPGNPASPVLVPGVLPRTLVHVFYEDSEDPDGEVRLLFEGEFVRYEYAKTDDNRHLRIFARDLSNLLSSIYVRYYSDFLTPYGSLVAAMTGQGTQAAKAERLNLTIINSTGMSGEILKALQSDQGGFGICAAFRSIVQTALSTNTFFENFNSRTRINDKIACFTDKESRLLLDSAKLESLLKHNMSHLKESATIWDLYAMLMSLVFYAPVPIAAPPYLDLEVTDVGSRGSTFTVAPAKTLASLLLKPYSWWTAPPNFNVIFPSQYKSFSMSRDFLSEPTRILMHAFGVIESLAQDALSQAAPSNYLFIAPETLQRRFKKEAFDSLARARARSREPGPIAAQEKVISDLHAERQTLGVQVSGTEVSAQDKRALQTRISQIDNQILEEERKLEGLVVEAEREIESRDVSEPQVAPKEIGGELWSRSVLTKGDGVSLASREDLKGIVFAFDYQNAAQVDITKAKGISADVIKIYLSNVANYKLSLLQYQNRTADVGLHFSPQLVAGFPALVIDPHRNFYGEVDSVTHVLDANGMADTQVRLSFVRGDEIEFTEDLRNARGKIQFPVWINSSYRPENVGEFVYRKLFPANRPSRDRSGIPAADAIVPLYGADQVLAANKIRSLYFASKDKDRFAVRFSQRNIASMKQAMVNVLGGRQVGQNFILKTVGDDRFIAAQAYAQAASRITTFARADSPQEVRT